MSKINLKLCLFNCGCLIKTKNYNRITVEPCAVHKTDRDNDAQEWYDHLEEMMKECEQNMLSEEEE